MDYESDSIFPRDNTGRDPQVRNMFRKGKVIEKVIDGTQVSCRVQELDKDGYITRPLPVKQFGSRSNQNFWCPEVGDDVSFTMLPNSENGEGFIDGSFYNTGNPPPITSPADSLTKHTTFGDGTIIEYRPKDNTLNVNAKGPVTIVTSGPVTIKGSMITLDATDVKITGTLWVDQLKPYQAGEIMSTPHVKNKDGSGNGS